MRVVLVGAGASGARAARQLLFLGPLDEIVVVDTEPGRAVAVAQSLGEPALAGDSDEPLRRAEPGDAVVIATPDGHRQLAADATNLGCHVVSIADQVSEVQALLALDGTARERNVTVTVGAGFSPGLSCVLASLGSRAFERVDEVHVSKVGTGGPACARHHHMALADDALDWRDGGWERRPGGSGRELCWFPDPVRGVDCYRAALPEALLLQPAFPDARRVTARMGATRRDRLTSRLPMLRKPHPEGQLGGVRIEVRGAQGVALDDRVLGAVDRPAVAAGAVAAMAARWALDGRLARTGASGLAGLVEPGPFLAALAERGVKVAAFEGGEHGHRSATSAALPVSPG